MALDRGTLAKIDRRVFAELDHGQNVHLAKVPLSEAVWSTWRRYCQAIGPGHGRGHRRPDHPRTRHTREQRRASGDVFAPELQRQLIARSGALDARQRRLDEREQSLRASERLLHARTRPLNTTHRANVGRNDPCPCGSGYKYKRCHGP